MKKHRSTIPPLSRVWLIPDPPWVYVQRGTFTSRTFDNRVLTELSGTPTEKVLQPHRTSKLAGGAGATVPPPKTFTRVVAS